MATGIQSKDDEKKEQQPKQDQLWSSSTFAPHGDGGNCQSSSEELGDGDA
jgi:hypothetical protein